MAWSLREATAADAEAVAGLVNRAFLVERFFLDGDRTSPAEIARLLESGTFLLAEADGQLAACVYLERRGERGYFGMLSVEPSRQGEGLGRQMVAEAEDRSRRQGCRLMEILVVDLRRELPPLYRRLGYVETGTRPFPAQERPKMPCHFIVMEKPLEHASLSALVASAEGGDSSAVDMLFATLYQELHRMAERQLARNAPDMSLGTTTLLHEAYLDMARREGPTFPDRARFMAYAARAMRTLIIDYVRRRKARKRGGDFEITSLEGDVASGPAAGTDLERLGAALDQLAQVDPLLAQVVDLKFFCGLTFAEIASLRGLSERTVQRHWDKARLYLHDAIGDGAPN